MAKAAANHITKTKNTGQRALRGAPHVTLDQSLSYAMQLVAAGRLAEALNTFDQALDKLGPLTPLLYNRAVTYQRLGRHEEAIQTYEQITEPLEKMAPVHFGIGVSLQSRGKLKEALRAYDRAIAIVPAYAEALNNRGIIYQRLGMWTEAQASHGAAVAAEPGYADAHNSLGAALQGAHDNENAIVAFDKALAINPDHRDALNNRAISLHRLGRMSEALECFDKLLAKTPDYIEAYSNRGNCLSDLRRTDDARKDYDRALKLDSSLASARFNRSLVVLQAGDFANGWPDYEYRSLAMSGDHVPVKSQGAWNGASLPDGTLYVRTEQGFGDAFQFVRYLPMVKERCGKVVLECQQELVNVLAGCPGCDEIVARSDDGRMQAAPAGAQQVYLLSLPHIFKTTFETIPANIPYLSVARDKRDAWAMHLSKNRTSARDLNVGIVWAGSTSHTNDRVRSCRLDDFKSIANVPGIQLFSLQKDIAATQLGQSELSSRIVDLGPRLGDFTDTAAAISAMDIVISVDTSVAHLAGALGKPVWTLLPHNPDWRWLVDGDDSPWYPTMRLFRQTKLGDWNDVFARVAQELASVTNLSLKAA